VFSLTVKSGVFPFSILLDLSIFDSSIFKTVISYTKLILILIHYISFESLQSVVLTYLVIVKINYRRAIIYQFATRIFSYS